MNKTDSELAVILGTSVQVVIELKEKWSYLSLNAVAIEAYQQVQGGF